MNLSQAYSAAERVCRRHARSFHFASFFLPRRKRLDAYAVYAFCRLIDDAVDVAEGLGAAAVVERLELFTAALDEIYETGRAPGSFALIAAAATESDPTQTPSSAQVAQAHASREDARLALIAFSHTVHRCGIPRRYFVELAEGCAMDLTVNRYATFAELERYCYHVAGVVGLIMCRVFQLRDERALEQAVQMGNAMQLTNILRDIREDWERGRVYLPAEELRRFGYSEDDLAGGVVNDAFRELMQFQIARARALYMEAACGLVKLDADGSRETACVMAVVYAGILQAIERQGYDVFTHRASLSLWQKLGRVPAALRLAGRFAGDIPEVF